MSFILSTYLNHAKSLHSTSGHKSFLLLTVGIVLLTKMQVYLHSKRYCKGVKVFFEQLKVFACCSPKRQKCCLHSPCTDVNQTSCSHGVHCRELHRRLTICNSSFGVSFIFYSFIIYYEWYTWAEEQNRLESGTETFAELFSAFYWGETFFGNMMM